eukprot:3685277-Rhodomonas_salina.5
MRLRRLRVARGLPCKPSKRVHVVLPRLILPPQQRVILLPARSQLALPPRLKVLVPILLRAHQSRVFFSAMGWGG